MKVRQRESIILKEKKEYVLIPYIKEEGIKKEWLQFLLPLDGLVIDELIKDGGKSLIFTQDCWVQLEFLPITRERATIIEDLKETFGAFGKKNRNDYQILFEYLDLETLKKEELIQLVIQAILEGAYNFNKEYLKALNKENIFEMRNQLTDEKDKVTLTIVTPGDFQEAIEKRVTAYELECCCFFTN